DSIERPHQMVGFDIGPDGLLDPQAHLRLRGGKARGSRGRTWANVRSVPPPFPFPNNCAVVGSSTERCSRARSLMACERFPGSSTKLASIESYATPSNGTPARANATHAALMSCPAFRTAG